jgi:ABC-type branched-subunit amino acid transport system permease subunit
MIVTTILLTMVWYIVWGFIFIIPFAFILFFGVIDGAFFAGTYSPQSHTTDNSDAEQVHTRCVVSLHGSRRHDLFHGILEMGDG